MSLYLSKMCKVDFRYLMEYDSTFRTQECMVLLLFGDLLYVKTRFSLLFCFRISLHKKKQKLH